MAAHASDALAYADAAAALRGEEDAVEGEGAAAGKAAAAAAGGKAAAAAAGGKASAAASSSAAAAAAASACLDRARAAPGPALRRSTSSTRGGSSGGGKSKGKSKKASFAEPQQEMMATQLFDSVVLYTPRGASGTGDDLVPNYSVRPRVYGSLAQSARQAREANEREDAEARHRRSEWLAGRESRLDAVR